MTTRSLLTGAALATLLSLTLHAGRTHAQGVPDIWVSRIDVPKTILNPGEKFTISVTVENRGTALALGSTHNGYMVDLSLALHYAGFPATSHVLPSPYRFVEGMLLKGGRISNTADLAAGASRQYSALVELPAQIKAGKYWVGITADSFNRLNETQPYPRGENDNVNNIDIQIVPPLAPKGAAGPFGK